MKRVTLKAAQAVIAAHRQAEEDKKAAANRLLIGRFFKYRNCYSCPDTEADYWWLYATVTGVTEFGSCNGWSFQHTATNEWNLQHDEHLGTIPQGWQEITAVEFWHAAGNFAAGVLSQMYGGGLVAW